MARPGEAGRLKIRVFNLLGQRVAEIFDNDVAAGAALALDWDGRNAQGQWLASGSYFIAFEGAGLRQVKKLKIVK
jgi:hypothetical protein